MRLALALCTLSLLLAGCKQEAKETVARAKGAAADAERTAKQVSAQAKSGAEAAAQQIREIGAGDVLEGTLTATGADDLTVRTATGGVETLKSASSIRWVARGASGVQPGARVRVTYIVQGGQKVATQVEAVER